MLESLEGFKELNEEQLNKLSGGMMECTSKYTNTSVTTNGGRDTGNNPNDWAGYTNDGGGCPDTTTRSTVSAQ